MTAQQYPTITARDEGDGYIVVRESGDYSGEVSAAPNPAYHEWMESEWTIESLDEQTPPYVIYTASAVVELDGEREMIPLDGTFESPQDAICAVAARIGAPTP